MKLKPREYQIEARNSIFRYFNENEKGHPLVAMPTGTGKSVVIADFLEQVFTWYGNQKILILTHVKELIEQNHAKLMAMWPTAPAGIYSSGLGRRDVFDKIIFAGIASIVSRAHEFGHVDLILIDEAHLVSPKDTTMYQTFIADLTVINPMLRIIGLTATPWRIGQGVITEEGGLFTDICFDLTGMEAFNWLISEGYLSPLIPNRTKAMLDVDGVHMRGGEFIAKELQTAVDKEEITFEILKEVVEVGAERKSWVIFASGIEHAEHVKQMLESMNISAAVVHGGNKKWPMTSKQRDQAIEDFKCGRVQAIVNNNVLTTGFDHPAIDLIVMLRPTGSVILWIQMLGRGTRPLYAPGYDLNTRDGRLAAMAASNKQDCLVLDFGRNTARLGPINDPLIPKVKGKKPGKAPVKVCEMCNTYNHATARFCMSCNNEFIFETKLKQGASTDDLIKADIPVVEAFKINHITYAVHTKQDRPPMMKVSYYCGYRMFHDYVCIEHTDFAGRKARQWWKARTDLPMPEKTEDALLVASQLNTPTSMRVWTNRKYPEILAFCYDGTNFGEDDSDTFTRPTTNALELKAKAVATPGGTNIKDYFDDDIPF